MYVRQLSQKKLARIHYSCSEQGRVTPWYHLGLLTQKKSPQQGYV